MYGAPVSACDNGLLRITCLSNVSWPCSTATRRAARIVAAYNAEISACEKGKQPELSAQNWQQCSGKVLNPTVSSQMP